MWLYPSSVVNSLIVAAAGVVVVAVFLMFPGNLGRRDCVSNS